MEFKLLKITVLTKTHTFAASDERVREAENITLDHPVVTTRPAKTFDYVKQEMNWADARQA